MERLFENYQDLYEADEPKKESYLKKIHRKKQQNVGRTKANTAVNVGVSTGVGAWLGSDVGKYIAKKKLGKKAGVTEAIAKKAVKHHKLIGAGIGGAVGGGASAAEIAHYNKKRKAKAALKESQIFESFYDLVSAGYSNLFETKKQKNK